MMVITKHSITQEKITVVQRYAVQDRLQHLVSILYFVREYLEVCHPNFKNI